ncbi:hypothetical protein [Xanthomonas arboricola]
MTDIIEQLEGAQFFDINQVRFELGSQMLSDGMWDTSVFADDPSSSAMSSDGRSSSATYWVLRPNKSSRIEKTAATLVSILKK